MYILKLYFIIIIISIRFVFLTGTFYPVTIRYMISTDMQMIKVSLTIIKFLLMFEIFRAIDKYQINEARTNDRFKLLRENDIRKGNFEFM